MIFRKEHINFIRSEYIVREQTIREIADSLGCPPSKIRNLMIEHNIPRRKPSEYTKIAFKKGKLNQKGNKHNRWKGGTLSYYRAISRAIKDKNECELCGSKRFLDIHHKDGNWKNNNPKNIQIVCRSCHNTIEPRFKGRKLESLV